MWRQLVRYDLMVAPEPADVRDPVVLAESSTELDFNGSEHRLHRKMGGGTIDAIFAVAKIFVNRILFTSPV